MSGRSTDLAGSGKKGLPLRGMLKGSISISLGFILLRFLLTPLRMQILTRVLSPADYGLITLLSMTATAAAMILSGGGFEVLMRKLPEADPEHRMAIFRKVFSVSGLLGLIASAVILVAPSFIPRYATVSFQTRIAAALLCLLFLHIHQRLYFLLGSRDHVRARTTQLLWSDLWFLPILVLLGLGLTISGERAIWIWCSWLTLIILLTWRWVPLVRMWKAPVAGPSVKDVLMMGLPMLTLVMAEWIFRLVGQYVLLASAGAAAMAIYALAFNIAGIGYVVGVPLVDSFTTQFNAAYADSSRVEDLRKIVSRALRIIFAVAIPVGLVFAFLAQPVVRLLAGPAFAGAAVLLPWTALIPCLLLINLLLGRVLLAENSALSVGVASIAGAIVSLCGCIFLVEGQGAKGVLLGVSIGLALTSAILAVRVNLPKWIDPEELRPGRLIVGGLLLAIAFASLGIPSSLPFVRLGVAAITALVVVLGFGWVTIRDFQSDIMNSNDEGGSDA